MHCCNVCNFDSRLFTKIMKYIMRSIDLYEEQYSLYKRMFSL